MNIAKAVIILFLFCCTSCTSLDQDNSNSIDPPYFDLAGYISSYVKDTTRYEVTKTIQIEGSTETKKIQNYPLWQDIHAFDAYDINRPALHDKYTIDTTKVALESSIIYRPKDPGSDLKVTLLQINFQKDQIHSILIETSTKSFLEQVKLQIEWSPTSGYMINRSADKIFTSKISKQKIEVRRSQSSR